VGELLQGEGGIEDVELVCGCVHEVAVHGGEHGVDDLFEVVVEVGLSFLGVGADAVLGGAGRTCMRSRRRLILSMSGS
jgi:hypothetical protein